eukprot:gnl/MRDRNA2_/MRDRNA2_168769_c0_seq1.p2 gnl/MRDRNA2_/MRDRNA2_168769_c0~~gnl/MRDRNA2_/MRDRNA2_168769_c0_seq1.p2  ORF type:complete len:128 (+),score=26.01 gnl/MRDRNA2_/MRDRNA2_168769_c0_seq1:1142-1525(+)
MQALQGQLLQAIADQEPQAAAIVLIPARLRPIRDHLVPQEGTIVLLSIPDPLHLVADQLHQAITIADPLQAAIEARELPAEVVVAATLPVHPDLPAPATHHQGPAVVVAEEAAAAVLPLDQEEADAK